MPWRLDKNGVTPNIPLNSNEQSKLNNFMNEVNRNRDPAEVGRDYDYDYKQLSNGRWQIRLSQNARAQFDVNRPAQLVTMQYVGNHP